LDTIAVNGLILNRFYPNFDMGFSEHSSSLWLGVT
jgi:hypothetical protein